MTNDRCLFSGRDGILLYSSRDFLASLQLMLLSGHEDDDGDDDSLFVESLCVVGF